MPKRKAATPAASTTRTIGRNNNDGSHVVTVVTTEKGSGEGGTTTPRGMKILMILSPAKTLDLNPMPRTGTTNTPMIIISWSKPSCDAGRSRKVVQAMKAHAGEGISHLSRLLKVSSNLASTAVDYWQSIGESSDADGTRTKLLFPTSKPCGFAFSGAAYQGLDISNLSSTKSLQYLQDTLRIVDPLYGWLRPMDEIEAYRLEMSTKGVFSTDSTRSTEKKKKSNIRANKKENNQSLAEYWKPSIRASIEKEADEASPALIVILNLASDEYSAAVDWPNMVKVVFRHGGRVLSVHAKRARGLMARYMAEHQIVDDIDAVKGFNLEGYKFRPAESTYGGPDTDLPLVLVFDRPVDWNRTTPIAKKVDAKTR